MTIDQFLKADDCLRKIHNLREQNKKLGIATSNTLKALEKPLCERCDDKITASIYYYPVPLSDATVKYLLMKERMRIELEIEKLEKILESI